MGNAIRALKAALLSVAFLYAQAGWSQEYTSSVGLLSDRDFYRAIACKAPPGRGCVEQTLKWPKLLRKRLSISLAGVQGSDPHFVGSARDALERVVTTINTSNSGVRLRGIWGPRAKLANIQIYIVEPSAVKPKIEKLSYPQLIGLSADPSVSVLSKLGNLILSAGIAIERNRLIESNLEQIILKEVLESLGLFWSIQNPHYDRISLFAASGAYPLARLKGQDLIALRIHHE